MENESFFEGVEKLLEIWFTSTEYDRKLSDLRSIPRNVLDVLMKDAHCEIISVMSSDTVDSYILSESSMFVSACRFILKTCGTTTPLSCVGRLLEAVDRYTNFDHVEDLFYSRKNFRRPGLQAATYRNFSVEVAELERLFPGGSAYCLGRMNADCWYLFTLDAPQPLRVDNGGALALTAAAAARARCDHTLEVVMAELDERGMSVFSRAISGNAGRATKEAGLDQLVPGMTVDAALFDPCGYSMNGLTPNGCYATVHVTPENEFSYASFETNLPPCHYDDVIGRVVRCFRPGKTLITVFSRRCRNSESDGRPQLPTVLPYMGRQRDLQYCSLRDYDLVYAFFERWPA